MCIFLPTLHSNFKLLKMFQSSNTEMTFDKKLDLACTFVYGQN